MKDAYEFYEYDHSKTLFPMDTSTVILKNGLKKILNYVSECNSGNKSPFSAQLRCSALKPNLHLRRTCKLDPISEAFFYDIIFRNRKCFTKSKKPDRVRYGYRFKDGDPISPSKSYASFKKAISDLVTRDMRAVRVDVANYFNAIYHHDLSHWFESVCDDAGDAQRLSQFFREINNGISVDFLPHGLYPAKMLGSSYLSFIEQSGAFRSDLSARFMDDVVFMDKKQENLVHDLLVLQEQLGQRHLSLNPQKTIWLDAHSDVEGDVGELKDALQLRKREVFVGSDGESMLDDSSEQEALTEEEIEYLLDRLKAPHAEEDDIELALALLREEVDDMLAIMPSVLTNHPHLAKNVYHFLRYVPDRCAVLSLIKTHLKNETIPEYQLFWLAKYCMDFSSECDDFESIYYALFKHPSATALTRAKLLEIDANDHGIHDLKLKHLRNGSSSWEAWASAAGFRSVAKSERNHALMYFARSSPQNKIIADIVSAL